MNTVWSTYIQTPELLYKTRLLRFSDRFQDDYMKAFNITSPNAKMLELGCGPGALSEALARWYPDADITGSDPDESFIRIASERNAQKTGLKFVTADAEALFFDNDSFDVTISHTVSEHVDPSKFYFEQYRVLKRGGVCVVLNPTRWLQHIPAYISEVTEFEKEIWGRINDYEKEISKKYGVAKYGLNEAERLHEIKKYGFRDISAQYVCVNLTPDNEDVDSDTAIQMIETRRMVNLDRLNYFEIDADIVTEHELEKMKELINQKYDKRIAQYRNGEHQWDMDVTFLIVIRAVKSSS